MVKQRGFQVVLAAEHPLPKRAKGHGADALTTEILRLPALPTKFILVDQTKWRRETIYNRVQRLRRRYDMPDLSCYTSISGEIVIFRDPDRLKEQPKRATRKK